MAKLPRWLERVRKSQRLPDPEPPLPLGNRSNGEYFHEQTDHERRIHALTIRRADELGRRMGLDRREFLSTSIGMTATLWAINQVACGGESPGGSGTSGGTSGGGTTGMDPDSTGFVGTSGNGYDLGDGPADSSTGDPDCPPPDGDYFILDVQTHHVDPSGSWRETNPAYAEFFAGLEQAGCGLDPIECLSQQQYLDLVFLGSQTTMAVLSSVPSVLCSRTLTTNCGSPLDNEQIAETRDLIEMLAQSGRSLNHCMITPNVDLEGQLEVMQMVHEERGVAGWKCYPPWGPTGTGWFLDDPAVGIPFIERARELDVNVICIHKGIPLPGFDSTHTDPRDVGPVAAMFPDVRFVVYHSAWLHGGLGNGEGPYDPDGIFDPTNPVVYPTDQGVNSLIRSVIDAGVGPGSNVYAELGSVWTNLMAYPDQAAHVLGKLMLFLGEDNILWGTDSIWTGSPQPLIEAFLAFQISAQFQETYGYPALDDARKRKILGLNAATVFGIDPNAMLCALPDEAMSRARRERDATMGARRWAATPAPGPRTRREFLRYVRAHGAL
jgi:hypothetical protein